MANQNAAQNLDEEARRKGGKVSSSQQDMSELGQKGGKVAHEKGTAHKFDSEEAREAGKQSHKND